MGATILKETAQEAEYPTLVVTAANWTMDVPLPGQFADTVEQAIEAGTRAIEAFKGLRNDLTLRMMPDFKDNDPTIGTILIVHIKGGDCDRQTLVYSHICLGNAGFYADSIKMHNVLKEQAIKIAAERKKSEEQALINTKDIALFESMKHEIASKNKPKPKKPKGKKK